MIKQLFINNYLAESKDEFPVLKLTEESKLILFKNKKVELQKVKELAKAVTVNEIETQYPETELSHNSELFDKLRNIRREQAEKENVPPYVIFSDATLMELATYLPQTKEELNEISGFGTFKIEKYGELFLSVIVEFCEQNNLSSLIFNKKPKKKREPKTVNKSPAGTFTTSYQMFKAGNSIEEIANIRNLAINTIQNHLVNFVTVGTIKPSQLMNTNKIEPILEIAKSQSIISLKAIKEELGEDYSYFEIHIAIAYYKSQY